MAGFFGTPRVPAGLIRRQRLLDRLDRRAGLTIVRGPSGLGKTSLVADWIRQQQPEPSGLWVTLPGTAGSPAETLWAPVINGMLDAGWGDRCPLLAEIDQVAVAEQRRQLVRALRHLPTRELLVIDRAVLTREMSTELLAVLADAPNLDCLLITRESGFPITNAELILDTDLIDAADLLLTDEELAEILGPALERHKGLDPDRLARMIGRLPAAARAAAVTLERHASRDDAATLVPAELESLVADACAALLLVPSHGPELGAFLAATSLSPVLTVELAALLSGVADSEPLLDQAEREGLGMWQSPAPSTSGGPSGERRFRYADGIRSALLQEYRRAQPERIPVGIRIIGRWAQDHGEELLALRCWLELGDLDAASSVVRDHMGDLLRFHTDATVAQLEQVPLERLREYPFLSLPLAVGHNLTDHSRQRAVEYCRMAAAGARLQQQRAVRATDLLMLQTTESVACRMLGDLDAALAAAERATQTLERLTVQDRDRMNTGLPDVLNQLAATYLRCGRYDRAQDTLSSSFAIAGLNGRGRRREQEFRAAGLAAAIHALRGELPAAAGIVGRIERSLPDAWVDGRLGDVVRLAKLIMALERLDFAEAAHYVQAGGENEPDVEAVGVRAMMIVGGALVAIADRRPQDACQQLTDALSSRTGPPIAPAEVQLIIALRSFAALCAGQTRRAIADADAVGRGAWHDLVLAITALAAGDPREALRRLGGSGVAQQVHGPHTINEPMERERWPGSAGLLQAAALARLGRDDAALRALRSATAQLARLGRRLALILVPRSDLLRLVALAEQHGDAAVLERIGDLAQIPDVLSNVAAPVRLTEREQVVLRHLTVTGSVASISRELNVSPNTVKSQVRSIYRKLGVSSRADALVAAAEHGLLGPTSPATSE